jgi:hypothetical protein
MYYTKIAAFQLKPLMISRPIFLGLLEEPNFPQISLVLVSQSVEFVIPPHTRGLVGLFISGGVLFVWFVVVDCVNPRGGFFFAGDSLIEDY